MILGSDSLESIRFVRIPRRCPPSKIAVVGQDVFVLLGNGNVATTRTNLVDYAVTITKSLTGAVDLMAEWGKIDKKTADKYAAKVATLESDRQRANDLADLRRICRRLGVKSPKVPRK